MSVVSMISAGCGNCGSWVASIWISLRPSAKVVELLLVEFPPKFRPTVTSPVDDELPTPAGTGIACQRIRRRIGRKRPSAPVMRDGRDHAGRVSRPSLLALVLGRLRSRQGRREGVGPAQPIARAAPVADEEL